MATTTPPSSSSQASEILSTDYGSHIDLDRLIQHIDSLLLAAKEERERSERGKKPSGRGRRAKRNSNFTVSDMVQPAASDLSKLLEGVSQGARMISDEKALLSKLSSESHKVAVDVLKGIGKAHWAAAGLLVVATVLERIDNISSNKSLCLQLLKEMTDLAKCVRKLKGVPNLEKEIEAKMEEAVSFILQGAIMCCTQIKHSIYYKFFLASANRGDLTEFRARLDHVYRNLTLQINLFIFQNSPNPVSSLLRPVPSHAVGIAEQVQTVTQLLDCESGTAAIAVILHGFGGIGKTTVADAVFANLKLENYKYSKINLNHKLELNPDIEKLQTQIIQDLTGTKQEIRDFRIGQEMLADILEKDHVVIYIDNVLKKEHLGKILPDNLPSPKTMRLLLTARNTDVIEIVEGRGIERYHIYDLKTLSSKSAMELLCKKMAVSEDSITTSGKMGLVNKIVKKCGGIPLVLEVVGGNLLRRKNEKYAYEEVFERLKSGEFYESNLVFAYEDLPEAVQEAFLDICFFYYGWDWDVVASIVGPEELAILAEGALVKKSPSEEVNVHDVFIGIARKISGGHRVTSTEQLPAALEQEELVGQLKGIWLMDNKKPFELPAEKLDQMHRSLRVVALGDWTLAKGVCNKTFQNLRFIQAGDIPHLPFNMAKLKELKFLDNGSGQDMGLSSSKTPTKLRILKFSERPHCRPRLQITTQTAMKMKDLRILKLEGLVQLLKLPEEISRFTKLIEMDLSRCNLVELPDCLHGLKELKKRTLRRCEGLRELPESIGNLSCLEYLDLAYCAKLNQLPAGFGSLNNLKCLGFKGCENLQELPESFGLLNSLEILVFTGCTSLKLLPSNFEKISKLKFLDFDSCKNLLKLPDGLGELRSLAWLGLIGCCKLTSLPASVGCLKSLQCCMSLDNCCALTKLPDEFCDLEHLERLGLSCCFNLTELPRPITKLSSLKKLNLAFCSSLKSLPTGFGQLNCLEELQLTGCTALKKLCVDFGDPQSLVKLIKLDLNDCGSLKGKYMDKVVKVENLEFVDIRGSRMLGERWQNMPKNDASKLTVATDQNSDEDKERLLMTAASIFFSNECRLMGRHGKEYSPSVDLPPKTTLVLVFESFISDDEWKLLAENLQGLQDTIDRLQIIYIHRLLPRQDSEVQKRMQKLPGKPLRLPFDNLRVRVIFEKILPIVLGADYRYSGSFVVTSTVEVDVNGGKCFYGWKNISGVLKERNFNSQATSCLHNIKHLIQTPQASSIDLLRALLVTEGTDSLLLAEQEVKLHDLKGKLVLLFISELEISEIEISKLKKVYEKVRAGRHDLAMVWIPIVDAYCDSWGSHMRALTSMPWPAIRDPWAMDSSVLKFVREDWHYNGRHSLLVVVDERGRILSKNAMDMIERWGAVAYPFCQSEEQHLKMEEWKRLGDMSSLEFLLQNFDCLSKVKEAMLHRQMICIYGGDPDNISEFMPGFSSRLGELGANIQIIYVGRMCFPEKDLNVEQMLHDINGRISSMAWLSFSFLDVLRFWKRVEYLWMEMLFPGTNESEKILSLRRLLVGLLSLNNNKSSGQVWMILLDECGEVVTGRGKEVVQLLLSREGHGIEEDKRKELMEGIKSGGLSELLKSKFEDGKILPQHHPHHSLLPFTKESYRWQPTCDLCGLNIEKSFYSCNVCKDFAVCEACCNDLSL